MVHTRSKVWKLLWFLQIPPKVKHFFWRACRDLLPGRGNLHKKIPEISAICPCCGEETETVVHALLKCTVAISAWFSSTLGLRNQNLVEPSFLGCIANIMKHLNKDQMEILTMIAWSIWNRRNDVVHGRHLLQIFEYVRNATKFLHEFRGARYSLPTSNSTKPRVSLSSWTKPPLGVIKVNSDASFKE